MEIEKVETKNIKETVRAIKSGEIKVVDLVKEHIEHAKKVHKQTNAFITIFDGETNKDQYDPIAEAKKIDALIEKGNVENKELLGIPFTAKDLYLVENTRTTFGSQYMKDFIAPYTGTVIQRCLDAGAILIGKTNCDPWGFGGSGENSGYGPAKNPYDLTRTPGGSSSGSAASLASGVGFFSLGTDTGGSVRQPASMTGLFGFKPTYGANSRYGIGVMGSSFDTPAFFARNSEDLVLLNEVMAGRDENDPTTFGKPIDLQRQSENEKFTFGVLTEFMDEGLNPEIKDSINEKIEELKANGHTVKEISIPTAKYGLAVYYTLVPAEISSNRARYDGVRFGPKVSDDYETNLVEGRTKYFENEVKRRIMIGTFVLSSGYADQFYNNAAKARQKIKDDFEKVFKKVDFIISPTSPTTAFKLGSKTNNPLEMYLADIYTVTANIAGIPAINIPIGMDSNNLPIGMQLMGSWFDDFKLIRGAGVL